MKKQYYRRASCAIYNLAKQNQGFWIVPDNCCHVVPAAILKAGCSLLVANIDKYNWTIDINDCKRLISEYDVKAIVWVRTFGNNLIDHGKHISDIKSMNKDILIIDDSCLCYPRLEAPTGNADIYLYSTGYGKPMDLNGGAFSFSNIAINIEELNYSSFDERRFDLLHKSMVSSQAFLKGQHRNVLNSNWINNSINESPDRYNQKIQENLQKVKLQKETINHIYSNIRDDCKLGSGWNDWRFQLRVKNTDHVIKKIFCNELFASRHYYPISKLYKNFALPRDTDYIWKNIHSTIINLFNDFRFTEDMALKLVEIINSEALPVESRWQEVYS